MKRGRMSAQASVLFLHSTTGESHLGQVLLGMLKCQSMQIAHLHTSEIQSVHTFPPANQGQATACQYLRPSKCFHPHALCGQPHEVQADLKGMCL